MIGAIALALAAGATLAGDGAGARADPAVAEYGGADRGSDLRRRIEVVGTDDVAQLARTFNTMLDRLEVRVPRAAGVRRQRRARTADADHGDPRALELMGDDPGEREETRALVLDELARMNRMVDDLLVLAKSERPDFLNWSEVNLTELVGRGGREGARPMADRAWRVDETADAAIVADGQRLTQALMQLVSNAIRHTNAATGSAVGSGTSMPDRRLACCCGWRIPGLGCRRRTASASSRDLPEATMQGGRKVPGSGWRSYGRSPGRTAVKYGWRSGRTGCAVRAGVADERRGRAMNRILIAEDEERIASFVERGLRSNGFVTTVVADGETAYQEGASGAYDLLMLDIGLPRRGRLHRTAPVA